MILQSPQTWPLTGTVNPAKIRFRFQQRKQIIIVFRVTKMKTEY